MPRLTSLTYLLCSAGLAGMLLSGCGQNASPDTSHTPPTQQQLDQAKQELQRPQTQQGQPAPK